MFLFWPALPHLTSFMQNYEPLYRGTQNDKNKKMSIIWLTAHPPYLLHAGQPRDDLVAVALVDEETLSFPGEAHLHRVLGDECVEEGVVLLRDSAWRRAGTLG